MIYFLGKNASDRIPFSESVLIHPSLSLFIADSLTWTRGKRSLLLAAKGNDYLWGPPRGFWELGSTSKYYQGVGEQTLTFGEHCQNVFQKYYGF